ncbi:hypothetical protein Avbf_08742 [Armadillidium vulgare]|nr:hypothetical protein Avbf_08742 [Armadillidium vulgare]
MIQVCREPTADCATFETEDMDQLNCLFGDFLLVYKYRHAIAIHGRKDEKTSKKGHFISQSWGLVVYSVTRSESTLGCTILIPGTAYLETREKIYHPGKSSFFFSLTLFFY